MEQTFGSFVREHRMSRGLSLRNLAAKLEISPVYMSNIETDRKPAPTQEKLDKLVDCLLYTSRILENFSLKVNESSLTGESEGVEKTADVIEAVQVALGDQKNMVFSGSLVTYGRATVAVTGTGMHTELGKVAALMNQTQQRKTPLQQSLDDFRKKLAVIILAICVVVFGLSLYREMPILDSLMFAVALAVAAIPEALSSIVTIVLAMGTQKMAKENAIIKMCIRDRHTAGF